MTTTKNTLTAVPTIKYGNGSGGGGWTVGDDVGAVGDEDGADVGTEVG